MQIKKTKTNPPPTQIRRGGFMLEPMRNSKIFKSNPPSPTNNRFSFRKASPTNVTIYELYQSIAPPQLIPVKHLIITSSFPFNSLLTSSIFFSIRWLLCLTASTSIAKLSIDHQYDRPLSPPIYSPVRVRRWLCL
jgi:hypothetical protein